MTEAIRLAIEKPASMDLLWGESSWIRNEAGQFVIFFKLEIVIIHIKHCVYVFLCAGTHTWVWCPWRPEKDIKSHGACVIGGYGQLDVCVGLWTLVLWNHPTISTARTSYFLCVRLSHPVTGSHSPEEPWTTRDWLAARASLQQNTSS